MILEEREREDQFAKAEALSYIHHFNIKQS